MQVSSDSISANVLLLSPYHGGSHAAWADGYRHHSRHRVQIMSLPARFWKWRMHGAAVTLARRFNEAGYTPDLILATDMLDLAAFLALTRKRISRLPVVLYMHENQLTYPLPSDGSTGPMRRQLGERDRHYAFINVSSMLAADEVWFNSSYHLESFYAALPSFLRHFPEYRELGSIKLLRRKSRVVPVGIDLRRLDHGRSAFRSSTMPDRPPLILWNQRWEYDKNPGAFFGALAALTDDAIPFRVALCGQQYGRQPDEFAAGLQQLGERVVHAGYAPPAAYARLLWEADIVISTAHHEFFGISILEAIYARALPILPARLSYPELIPRRFHSTCLYKDQDGLITLLREALANGPEAQITAKALAAETARFDWQHIGPTYDRLLRQALF
jgi:glycosyltransferase involved in cell wall biosynthesis